YASRKHRSPKHRNPLQQSPPKSAAFGPRFFCALNNKAHAHSGLNTSPNLSGPFGVQPFMAGYLKILRTDLATGTHGRTAEEYTLSYVTGSNTWVKTFDYEGLLT